MLVEIINQNKSEIELKMDNSTIAEILRVYLNNKEIEFAAWRKEHPAKPITFRVVSSSKNVIKDISDAVNSIKKDLDNLSVIIKKK